MGRSRLTIGSEICASGPAWAGERTEKGTFSIRHFPFVLSVIPIQARKVAHSNKLRHSVLRRIEDSKRGLPGDEYRYSDDLRPPAPCSPYGSLSADFDPCQSICCAAFRWRTVAVRHGHSAAWPAFATSASKNRWSSRRIRSTPCSPAIWTSCTTTSTSKTIRLDCNLAARRSIASGNVGASAWAPTRASSPTAPRQTPRIGGAAGLATVNNGPNDGRAWLVSANKVDVAFLGEVRAGLACQIGRTWRAVGEYRVVGVSGVALPTNQIFPDLRGLSDVELLATNGNLLLHGAFVGLERTY